MLTLSEAAEEIGVSKRWLQYWLAEHQTARIIAGLEEAGLFGAPAAQAPSSCPQCHDATDCSNVDICNAVAQAYSPAESGLPLVESEELARSIDFLAFKALDNSYRVPSDDEFARMKAAREKATTILAKYEVRRRA